MPKSVEHEKPDAAPPMAVLLRDLETIRPAAVNPRTHSPRQVEQLAASIAELGWTQPLLYDVERDETVAGHGRTAAATLLYSQGQVIKTPSGRELPPGTIPIIDVSGWTEEQKRAALLADNALAEQAGWDVTSLGAEIQFLDASGFNLDLIGFSPAYTLQFLNPGEPTSAKAEWVDMPEFDQGNLKPFRQIILSFRNAEDVSRFAELLGQTVTDKTRSLWFPKEQIDGNKGQAYV